MGLKEDYLTISEAAEQIGVTRQTISRWLKSGRLKSEKLGRVRLVSKKELLSVQKSDRMVDMWEKKIVGGAIEIIRLKLNYGKEDKIEPGYILGKFHGYLTFVVIRKDGKMDRIKFYPHFRRDDDGVLYWASKIERETYIKTGQDSFSPINDIDTYIAEKKQRGVT